MTLEQCPRKWGNIAEHETSEKVKSKEGRGKRLAAIRADVRLIYAL